MGLLEGTVHPQRFHRPRTRFLGFMSFKRISQCMVLTTSISVNNSTVALFGVFCHYLLVLLLS